jgi:hypothetical protein
MGHSFLQWSGTLRVNLLTEEGDHGCSEDTLCQVDQDPVRLKPVEESPWMSLAVLGLRGENEDII